MLMKKKVLQKSILISLIYCSLLFANNVEREMGINVGMVATKNSDGSEFKSPSLGLTYQDNSYVIMPRFDLDYVSVKDDKADTLIKGSLNGIYEFENQTNTSPYLLGGMGYEYVKGGIENEFESHPFIQGGGGVNFSLENDFKINVEAKMLQVIGGENEENEVMLTAGFHFPLSYKKAKVIRRVIPRPIIQPAPQIIQVVPPVIPEPRTQVMYINNNECSIKIDLPDLDRDGVEDSLDQCPATPCNFTVDHYGCPIKATLKINFATNSATIEYDSMYKVDNFAKFLLKNKGSMVKIVGHTDNVGTDSHNLSLSNRRAIAVMQALISKGVSPARLSAEGKGESMPIASNNSIEGRAMNRRIEAELTYPRGRK
jgi:OOP family OmpA-OmpF porin